MQELADGGQNPGPLLQVSVPAPVAVPYQGSHRSSVTRAEAPIGLSKSLCFLHLQEGVTLSPRAGDSALSCLTSFEAALMSRELPLTQVSTGPSSLP